MRKKLLLTSLLLGIAFDILFWKKSPGISFIIFVLLCLTAVYLLLRVQNISPDRKSLFILVPIIFFSVMTFIRSDPLTSFLNYTLTLFSAAVLVMTYRSGLWILYGLSDYTANTFHLIGSMFSLGWFQITNTDSKQKTSDGRKHKNRVWPIVRGLLLASPVLLVFTALFSSADLIFAQRLDDFLVNLNPEKLTEIIFRGSYIIIIAYFLVGIIRHVESRSQNKKLIGLDKPTVAPFLGFTEASIILGSVLILFSAFVVIQFQYFFSGQANIIIEGFTYSEYARRGFGELVTVAVFSLILLQSLSAITKRESNKEKKIFSGLVVGLVLLVIIILASSFQRLFLYESAYGFSQLRTYSHVFMIWLGILLMAVVAIEILKHQRAFANIALLVLMGFTASLNTLNVDGFVARQNINRAVKGKELDVSYLSTLTSDAVPTLAKAYSSSDLPSKIKDGIGAAIVCYVVSNEPDDSQAQSWQSFHFSDWNAARELDAVRESLKRYRIQDDAWPTVVISPNGTEYPCHNFLFFD
jgi:hypothetical protein